MYKALLSLTCNRTGLLGNLRMKFLDISLFSDFPSKKTPLFQADSESDAVA